MRKIELAVIAAVLFYGSPALADSSGDMMNMLEGLKRQMAQMQQTIEKQNIRIQQLESKTVLETPRPSVPVQPTPAAMSDGEWQKGIKDNLGEAFPWLKGAKFGGDFRLRYEAFDFFDKSDEAGSTGTAADRTRNRFRIRLRWGFEKDYGDDWKVGFRLATGNTSDQTATNQTLGNSGYFNYKTINIDRAWAEYRPASLQKTGALKGVTVGGGKFDNPFLRYSTGIVWDPDVTPEGLYEKAEFKIVETDQTKVGAQAVLGQFLMNEDTGIDKDAVLYGYQGSLVVSSDVFGLKQPTDLSISVSYYDYVNWFQTVTSNTSGNSYLRTNTSALDDPRVLDIYPELVFSFDRTPVTVWYDYAKNVGEIDPTRAALNDAHADDDAWGVGLKIGKAKKKGDWELFYGYYQIAPNAVVAAFSDSDFGGPGGVGFTNRVGHKFGLGCMLTDAVMLSWTASVTEPLYATTLAASSTDETVFRSQVDLVWKF